MATEMTTPITKRKELEVQEEAARRRTNHAALHAVRMSEKTPSFVTGAVSGNIGFA